MLMFTGATRLAVHTYLPQSDRHLVTAIDRAPSLNSIFLHRQEVDLRGSDFRWTPNWSNTFLLRSKQINQRYNYEYLID